MKTIKHASIFIFVTAVLLLQLASSQSVSTAAAQTRGNNPVEAQSSTKIFLPHILGAGQDNGGPVDDQGSLWLPYTLGDGSVLPTYGASVAVDSRGGIHAVFAIYIGRNEYGNRPATYAHCTSGCGDKTSWTFTHIGEDVQDARIALDPNGRPRIMLFGPVFDPTWPRMRYQYAACDSSCSYSASWTITTIATPIEPTATREYDNNRYFAVDSQGHPAFVYTDTTQNDHPGTFYMSCQSGCTNAGNWVETILSDSLFDKVSLAFSAEGHPRLAFGFFDENVDLYLSYAQCDVGCESGANWSGTTLVQVHGTAMYSLAADSNGQPRMAVYTGSYAYDPFEDHKLLYLWCDAQCGSASGWYFTGTGLPFGSGDGVSLALDQQDRPRMSFENDDQGLGYAWCNTECESDNGAWQALEVESQDSLANNYEVLPIRRCTVSTWFNGQRSSLALDPSGNPRIAYDAQHWWYGTEDIGGVPHQCNYQDVTVTRISLLEQP